MAFPWKEEPIMNPQNNDELKKSAFGGMIWKFAERVCAQLVAMVVSIILARMLMPEDYAPVAIVAIFFSFCYLFISGGLSTALTQKKNVEPEDYSTVLFASLTLATVLYVLVFLLAPFLARVYKNAQLIPLFRVMALSFFINAFKSVYSSYTYATLQFKKFFLSTIVGTVISAFVGIGLAMKGFGVWALVAQDMTNATLDTLILYLSTRLKIVRVFSFERLKSLLQFGWKMFVSSVISLAYDQVNPLIIGLRFKAADLSYYNKGNSFPSLINNTLGDTMSAVLFPVMAKVQDSKEDILNITRRYVKVASYVIFPVMVGLFSVADSFIELLLTDKWLPAVPFVQIYCISYMFNLLQVGNLQAIKAIGRSDVILKLEVLKKSIYIFVIASFVFLSPNAEIMAFNVNVCAMVGVTMNTLASRKLIAYYYRYQFVDFLPNLVSSVVMGVLVSLIGKLALPLILLLPLQVFAGAVIYVGISLVTGNENFYYLLDIIKSMLKRG